MSAWSHLPNAGLIDRILADLPNQTEVWREAGRITCGRDWITAWYVSLGAADAAFRYGILDAVREAARDRPWAASHNLAREAAWGAISALISWDRAGSYLDLSRDQIKVLAALGDNIALLIHPAVIVFEYQREMA